MAPPRSAGYPAATAPAAADSLAKSRRENLMLPIRGADARAGNGQHQAALAARPSFGFDGSVCRLNDGNPRQDAAGIQQLLMYSFQVMRAATVLQSASAIVIASWWLGAATAAAPQPAQPRLDFEVQEGLNINRFVREGNVAAHLVLRSGTDPRILIAFPAGNSGVGLWFAHQSGGASWTLSGRPEAVHGSDGR